MKITEDGKEALIRLSQVSKKYLFKFLLKNSNIGRYLNVLTLTDRIWVRDKTMELMKKPIA